VAARVVPGQTAQLAAGVSGDQRPAMFCVSY